jgi:hypothetical protein
MRTGRKIAIIVTSWALVLTQAVPAAWAAGSGKGAEKSDQKTSAQQKAQELKGSEALETEQPETECQSSDDGSTAPADGTTTSTCGPKANVNLTDLGKAVEHNPKADASGQLVPGTAGSITDGATDTGTATADATAVDTQQVKSEHIAKVKADSRVQAKTDRAKGEKGAYLVYVNGERLNLTPLEHNGRTLVPFRVLSEFLGATVSWEQSTHSITMVKGDTTVTFSLGSTTATVNGETVELQVAPELVNDSTTFVPLRFIAEALGADVDYDAETGAITVITTPAAPADGTTTAPADGTTTAPADGTTTAPATGTTSGTGN